MAVSSAGTPGWNTPPSIGSLIGGLSSPRLGPFHSAFSESGRGIRAVWRVNCKPRHGDIATHTRPKNAREPYGRPALQRIHAPAAGERSKLAGEAPVAPRALPQATFRREDRPLPRQRFDRSLPSRLLARNSRKDGIRPRVMESSGHRCKYNAEAYNDLFFLFHFD